MPALQACASRSPAFPSEELAFRNKSHLVVAVGEFRRRVVKVEPELSVLREHMAYVQSTVRQYHTNSPSAPDADSSPEHLQATKHNGTGESGLRVRHYQGNLRSSQ